MPNPPKPFVHPDSWFELGLQVAVADAQYDPWPELPWLSGKAPGDGEPEREDVFEAAEAPHVERIVAAIDSWLSTGEHPPLADEPHYFFSLRRQVVGSMFITFDSVSDILPPPKRADYTRVARRFLVDWWRSHGPMRAVAFTITE
jgi:hypothetical protein